VESLVWLEVGPGGLVLIGFCAAWILCRWCKMVFIFLLVQDDVHFLSKCLRLAVIFNFKSNKFNSWHQNITGKSRGPGTYWELLD
jgi:hypothetical protein